MLAATLTYTKYNDSKGSGMLICHIFVKKVTECKKYFFKFIKHNNLWYNLTFVAKNKVKQ